MINRFALLSSQQLPIQMSTIYYLYNYFTDFEQVIASSASVRDRLHAFFYIRQYEIISECHSVKLPDMNSYLSF